MNDYPNPILDPEFKECLASLEQEHGRRGIPWPRVLKCWSFFQLAKAAHSGCIVELGTWKGYGATALWFGSQAGYGVDVYTVDIYQDITGWAGEKYTSSDHREYLRNVKKSGIDVTHVIGDFKDIGRDWDKQVALLVWDGGVYSMQAEIDVWRRSILSGGVIAIHDTEDGKLGSGRYINGLTKSGYDSVEQLPGGVFAVRKGLYAYDE